VDPETAVNIVIGTRKSGRNTY